MSRSILKIVKGVSKIEGTGVQIYRSLAIRQMRNFTPFMLLDHFKAKSTSGFGPHPHSGMETISYILKGGVAHEDFTGARGLLMPGDLQFMTAGKAIVHTEMPVPQSDGSDSEGVQLWVDLPKKSKEVAPRYRDLRSFEIPTVQSEDGSISVKIISGKAFGVENYNELSYTPVHYYHYSLKPDTEFEHRDLPDNFNYFLYVLRGELVVNGEQVPQFHNCFFNRDSAKISGASQGIETEFVLIGGEVLDQKVFQDGPFVHTDKKRVDKAYRDFKDGVDGFECVKTWVPTIDKGITQDMLQGALVDLVQNREKQRKRYLEEKLAEASK